VAAGVVVLVEAGPGRQEARDLRGVGPHAGEHGREVAQGPAEPGQHRGGGVEEAAQARRGAGALLERDVGHRGGLAQGRQRGPDGARDLPQGGRARAQVGHQRVELVDGDVQARERRVRGRERRGRLAQRDLLRAGVLRELLDGVGEVREQPAQVALALRQRGDGPVAGDRERLEALLVGGELAGERCGLVESAGRCLQAAAQLALTAVERLAERVDGLSRVLLRPAAEDAVGLVELVDGLVAPAAEDPVLGQRRSVLRPGISSV
jgi:hypothetical protein